MFAVKLLFCISLIVGSRADGFEFNNPEGFEISVVDETGIYIYSSIATMNSVKWTPSTRYVTVTVKENHENKQVFTKQFRTSVGNGHMCNYALLIMGYDYYRWTHYKSSFSSPGCTDDGDNHDSPLMVFDNGSDHKVYPSFAAKGEQYSPDRIHGILDPGCIRIYSADGGAYLPPVANIYPGVITATAVFDPYLDSYITCTDFNEFYGKKFLNFKAVEGERKCEDKEIYGETEETALAKENESLQQANKALLKALKELAA